MLLLVTLWGPPSHFLLLLCSTINTLEHRQKLRHSTDIEIIYYSLIMKELCPFSSNIVKVRLFEQNGADVMCTNANDQRIL